RVWSQDHQLGRQGVEPVHAVGGADHDVLDAGAVAAFEVHAGLDGEGHARFQRERVAGDDVRRLVAVEPDAVPGAVQEVPTVAGPGQRTAGGRVDALGGHPRTYRRDRGLLGGAQGLVGGEELGRWLAAGDVRAGAVGAVAGPGGTPDVDHDRFA